MEKYEKFEWKEGDLKKNLCSSCKRFRRGILVEIDGERFGTCDAFPNGIPREIELGDFDHHEEYAGDNGIRYEKG